MKNIVVIFDFDINGYCFTSEHAAYDMIREGDNIKIHSYHANVLDAACEVKKLNDMKQHIIVFDGTSYYVIPKDQIDQEDDIDVIGSYDNLDVAFEIAADLNISPFDRFKPFKFREYSE